MLRKLIQLAVFLALSVTYGVASLWLLFWVSIDDCGMGPDARADCYASNNGQVPVGGIALALIYIGLSMFYFLHTSGPGRRSECSKRS